MKMIEDGNSFHSLPTNSMTKILAIVCLVEVIRLAFQVNLLNHK